MTSKKRIACLMLLLIMMCANNTYASTLSASYVAKCTNLKVGEEYKVHVELQDQNSGAIAMSDGKALSSDVKFKATQPAMDVQVGLRINKEENAGKTLLIKTTLYKGTKSVAVISDGSKARDRITIPAVSVDKEKKANAKQVAKKDSSKKTQAKNEKSTKSKGSSTKYTEEVKAPDVKHIKVKSHVTDAASGTGESKARNNATIYDNLELDGLEVGEEYTAKTILKDAETGKPIENVKAGKIKFKAKKSKEKVRISVNLDASELEDIVAVTFTEVYHGKELVAETSHIEADVRTIVFNKYDVSGIVLSRARYDTINSILHMTKGFSDLFDYEMKS